MTQVFSFIFACMRTIFTLLDNIVIFTWNNVNISVLDISVTFLIADLAFTVLSSLTNHHVGNHIEITTSHNLNKNTGEVSKHTSSKYKF